MATIERLLSFDGPSHDHFITTVHRDGQLHRLGIEQLVANYPRFAWGEQYFVRFDERMQGLVTNELNYAKRHANSHEQAISRYTRDRMERTVVAGFLSSDTFFAQTQMIAKDQLRDLAVQLGVVSDIGFAKREGNIIEPEVSYLANLHRLDVLRRTGVEVGSFDQTFRSFIETSYPGVVRGTIPFINHIRKKP